MQVFYERLLSVKVLKEVKGVALFCLGRHKSLAVATKTQKGVWMQEQMRGWWKEEEERKIKDKEEREQWKEKKGDISAACSSYKQI